MELRHNGDARIDGTVRARHLVVTDNDGQDVADLLERLEQLEARVADLEAAQP